MKTTHPELAQEAYGWEPENFIAGTNKKLAWKCSNEHVWEATGNKRILGQGCPFCSNRKVLVGFNDMKTTHPELAQEACGR